MFGYQQTAFNYGTYASANGQQTSYLTYGGQQPTNTATVVGATTTAANPYATSQYSLAASAYAQYSQAAQQQQQQTAAAVGSYQPAQPASTGTSSATTTAATGGSNPLTLHYAGYEAAVYAAASSYVQAKTHGQTKTWMQKAGNRGFQKKRFGLGHQNQEQLFCETCKISCAGQQAYKDHIEGKPHRRKVAQSKAEANSKSRTIGFRCEVCEVTMSSKDTFDAHVKGQKHQRTIAVLRRMGKPVPEFDTATMMGIGVAAAPTSLGQPIPTVGSGGPLKKVVGVTGTKFVGGSLLTTGVELKQDGGKGSLAAATITGAIKPQDLEKALLGDENIKPIGQEFIEEEVDATGKFVSYGCKLCDCKFSDKGARDVHLKGRRHRLNYKQKVDPSLKVEMKGGQWGKGGLKGRASKFVRPYREPENMFNFQPSIQPRPLFPMARTQEIMDDRHIMTKLQQIDLNQDEEANVERLASFVEKTLKAVSDAMMTNAGGQADQNTDQERALKGVMRIGLLAKHLLLKSDKQFDLVMLCSKTPTVTLLKKVAELFKTQAEVPKDDQLTVKEMVQDAALVVSLKSIAPSCRVTFTSVSLRDGGEIPVQPAPTETGAANPEAAKEANEEKPPLDPLPKEPCLQALAELRHAKFYQVKCVPLHSMNTTVKIVRDISDRVLTWKPLHNWAIELMVEKTLSSIAMPLSPGDAVRRLFEVVSSGVFLSKRSKLLDPCEKEPVDVLEHVGDQEREDITSSAQHALRLIAYNQIYKILGIDRLPDPLPPKLKRSHTEVDTSTEQKKVKVEEK